MTFTQITDRFCQSRLTIPWSPESRCLWLWWSDAYRWQLFSVTCGLSITGSIAGKRPSPSDVWLMNAWVYEPTLSWQCNIVSAQREIHPERCWSEWGSLRSSSECRFFLAQGIARHDCDELAKTDAAYLMWFAVMGHSDPCRPCRAGHAVTCVHCQYRRPWHARLRWCADHRNNWASVRHDAWKYGWKSVLF